LLTDPLRLSPPQDTIRFWPLAVTMLGMSFRDPVVVTRVVRLVRPPPHAHFTNKDAVQQQTHIIVGSTCC
jgi:hypothetical protein